MMAAGKLVCPLFALGSVGLRYFFFPWNVFFGDYSPSPSTPFGLATSSFFFLTGWVAEYFLGRAARFLPSKSFVSSFSFPQVWENPFSYRSFKRKGPLLFY